MMDQAAEFAAALPAWTGSDGLPMSWRHFIYGMGHLSRSHHRSILSGAAATRGGMATEESYAGWRSTLEQRA